MTSDEMQPDSCDWRSRSAQSQQAARERRRLDGVQQLRLTLARHKRTQTGGSKRQLPTTSQAFSGLTGGEENRAMDQRAPCE